MRPPNVSTTCGFIAAVGDFGKRHPLLAFLLTHWVNLPNQPITAPVLASRPIARVQLRFLG